MSNNLYDVYKQAVNDYYDYSDSLCLLFTAARIKMDGKEDVFIDFMQSVIEGGGMSFVKKYQKSCRNR